MAGVPINVVAAGAIAGGVTTAGAGAGAGNLIQHARVNDNRLLHEADVPKVGRGKAGDPLPDSTPRRGRFQVEGSSDQEQEWGGLASSGQGRSRTRQGQER